MDQEKIIGSVRLWLESFVVELNLCPFARRELENNRVRFVVADAVSEAQLLLAVRAELDLLNSNSSIETTLLIHPKVLQDFFEYNQFLNEADALLVAMELEGVYQIASFHPDYQFGGTEPDDAENYTNRSPFPMLHLLREESLERAIANYQDIENIPERNIALMNSLGKNRLQEMLQTCLHEISKQKI